jgi:hypothetical protein
MTRAMQRGSWSLSNKDKAERDESFSIQRALIDGIGDTLSTVLRLPLVLRPTRSVHLGESPR